MKYLNYISFFILFFNLFFIISSSNNNIDLYISNNGNDNSECGLNKENKCKTINFAINSVFKKLNKENNKLRLLLENGVYDNIESFNIDFDLTLEKLSFKEKPILKFIDEEDQVTIREHEEDEDSTEDDYYYEDYEDDILEEIEENQDKEDKVVLIKKSNCNLPMFNILSASKQVSFKGITFRNNQGFNYFIESLNHDSLALNVLNCKFENQENQFINIFQETNINNNKNNIKLLIKNSIFIGSHNKEIPKFSGSINFKSNQSFETATFSVENSIFKNIRGCPLYLKNTNSADIEGRKNFNFNLKNTIFNNNIQSNNGGAISLSGFNNASIENSVFENNVAIQQGGSISISKVTNIEVLNCRFNKNKSGNNGGSIFFYIAENVKIEDSKFVENLGSYGGSNYFENCSQVILKSNSFIDNRAVLSAGSIYCRFSNISLADYGNKFKGNTINIDMDKIHRSTPQVYNGFDCYADNAKGSTCFITGANETFIQELLQQPNCGGTSISFFILDNIEYIILSISFLFIPIIVLFVKMANKRSEHFKQFLISEEELNEQESNDREKKKQPQNIKKRK
ncbi:hypothetical protein DICPUDRAFT_82188 [Dictyostelium purpureum]|uniref:Right handed beta helix domain-containing protein n=1 Tax=Dictyostelium purpureum TaxID=5786 RepID=F0ZVS6_DICPU|nr:uncharacterized protein DICPUDRAFT_82188 [Dictyostelium purpureum]EGC31955.1 hypothetical protein DICPUDRAFT_82188 [Dictyostelium purpureum]|eukprot:XP_003291524.1 hypothetical protein DICPUDRAFT_82188 [Dictyostelium purpureum]